MSINPASDEPKSGDVVVNGIRLHYLDWGGDGTPILLLHATGFLGAIYRPTSSSVFSLPSTARRRIGSGPTRSRSSVRAS